MLCIRTSRSMLTTFVRSQIFLGEGPTNLACWALTAVISWLAGHAVDQSSLQRDSLTYSNISAHVAAAVPGIPSKAVMPMFNNNWRSPGFFFAIMLPMETLSPFEPTRFGSRPRGPLGSVDRDDLIYGQLLEPFRDPERLSVFLSKQTDQTKVVTLQESKRELKLPEAPDGEHSPADVLIALAEVGCQGWTQNLNVCEQFLQRLVSHV